MSLENTSRTNEGSEMSLESSIPIRKTGVISSVLLEQISLVWFEFVECENGCGGERRIGEV